MLIWRTVAFAGFFVALCVSSADAQTSTAPPDGEAVVASFATSVLAGGTTNTVTIPLAMDRIPGQLQATFEWSSARRDKELFSCEKRKVIDRVDSLTKAEQTAEVPNGDGKRTVTVVTFYVPSPHCSWPPMQQARVTLSGNIREAGGSAAKPQVILASVVRVTVFWFPFTVALAVVAARLCTIWHGMAKAGWRKQLCFPQCRR